jgi:hypothetical protein
MSRRLLLIAAIFTTQASAQTQHGGTAPPARVPPREAAQFNFLVGQWELSVKPAATSLAQRVHGTPKLTGTWKGWRALDGWGIEDELRITDASGNPMALTHALRLYDVTAAKWKTSAVDPYRSIITSSTAEWRGAEMLTSSQGKDAEGKPYLSRGTFSKISPSTFRYIQQRSTDNGKTWNDNLTIDAKRVSATATR